MTPTSRSLLALLVLGLAGCGNASDEADGAATTPAATAPSEAARAAAISNALEAAPAKSDSILSANGLTVAQLEAMMLRIARDSAASDEYRRLTSPQ